MIQKTLAILAGGKSSRMNYNNKAKLIYNEKTFIKHIIQCGINFDEIIIISNDKQTYNEYNIKVYEDIYKDKGALGGIYSALCNSKYDEVLCIACDMPLIKKQTLEYIANIKYQEDILIPQIDEKLQPLCAVYKKNLKNDIEESIIKDENKMMYFVKIHTHKIIKNNLDSLDFTNINTELEYRNLREMKYVNSRNNNK